MFPGWIARRNLHLFSGNIFKKRKKCLVFEREKGGEKKGMREGGRGGEGVVRGWREGGEKGVVEKRWRKRVHSSCDLRVCKRNKRKCLFMEC